MKPYEIGALASFNGNPADLDAEFARFEALEFNACQFSIWNQALYTAENAKLIADAAKKHSIRITALWAGWSGPTAWNFTEGPITLGIVPKEYREVRIADLKRGSAFAEQLGVTDVITHAGFLPENMTDPEFHPIADALYDIASACKERGQWFLFETGQETPVTMLRYIEEIGTGNLGINLDTANLILYGKANTVDALDVFGKYVRNTHFKDGFYPTTGRELGRECALGEGKANVPGVIAGLQKLGYTGPYIIEREIAGDQQTKDILKARDLIRSCLA